MGGAQTGGEEERGDAMGAGPELADEAESKDEPPPIKLRRTHSLSACWLSQAYQGLSSIPEQHTHTHRS